MSERGPLDEFSPTKVECYDPTTTWGCPTRWWFKYVDRRPEPQDAALVKGTEMHSRIEHYLKTGEDVLGPIERVGKWIIDGLKPMVVGVEYPVPDLVLEGIPVSKMSKIDVRLWKGIVDWKSSSNIQAYGKTPAQLRKNHQVIIYLKAAIENQWFDPNLDIYEGSHVYFGTKKREAEKREAFLTRDQIETGIEKVKTLLREMKDVAKEKEPGKLAPNMNACDIGRGCPHRHICPHKGGKEDLMASLIKRFTEGKTEGQIVQEARGGIVPPAQAVVDSTAKTLPPDAPKSDPAKASDGGPLVPPPLTEKPAAPAAEPEKKGPGRPKKRLEIKDESMTPDAPKTEAPKQEPAAKGAHPEVYVNSVTVRHGLTLNMGNYSSAKVEVEMSGTYANGTAEQAREMLGGRVYAAAMEEAKKYAEKKS